MSESGFWELIVIFVLALLVIGPERLPEVAKKVGYWVGKARRFVAKVRSDVESEFRNEDLQRMLSEQSKEIQDLRTIVSEAASQTRHSAAEMDAALNAGMEDMKASVATPEAAKAEPESEQKALPDVQTGESSEKAAEDKPKS